MAEREIGSRPPRAASGCLIAICAVVFAFVAVGVYVVLWGTGLLDREPSILAEVEPHYVLRIYEDEFSASGTGSGTGEVMFYESEEPFEVVKQHYVHEMAKHGYAVNQRPIYTGSLHFTKNPDAEYPKVCFYLEPWPAEFIATHLRGARLENLLEHYRPTYTIAYWKEWGFPFSGGVC